MKLLLALYLFAGIIVSSNAQSNLAPRTFEKARELANAGKFDESIVILEKLKDSIPQNNDYKIYLARVYSWNKDYRKAIETLTPLTETEDFSLEVIQVMVTIQLWAECYEEVIRYANLGLKKYKDPEIYMQNAKALEALNREKEAKEILRAVILEDAENKEARALQTMIFQKNTQHISFSYLNTSFGDPGFNPWHMVFLEYKSNLRSVPVLARLNYANLFGRNGSLFEIDAYPKTGDKSYLYINAGATIDTPIFPEIKGGLEFFQTLNETFELSVGGKFLGFDETQVLLFNGGITHSTRNNLRFNYKPFFTYIEGNWLTSHSLAVRIINPVKESFMQLDVQYGSIPYVYVTSSAFTDLNSIRLGIQYYFRITENLLIQPVFMYEFEEYFPSVYRNRFNSQIITFFRFK